MLISNHHLEVAEDGAGAKGITKASLSSESRWRREAGAVRKLMRMLKDGVGSV
jgi:hypothetical protein